MSKPIVVIWQNGVNLFQDNTNYFTFHARKADLPFTFHNKQQTDSLLR